MSLTPQPSRKRDRFRKIFGRSRSRSTSRHSQTTAAPHSTPPPDPSTARIGSSILADALEALGRDDRHAIRGLLPANATSIDTAVQEAQNIAKELQRQCAEERWTCQVKGRTVYLSDHVDKVLQLLDKVKSAGDVAVSADPVHAGLPWAGIRIILEVC